MSEVSGAERRASIARRRPAKRRSPRRSCHGPRTAIRSSPPAREPGPQPAQVEEQRLLGGARAAPDDRPVAQDVILDRGADPPGRVGREADLALRLEARSRLQKAHMALLDEVGHGQAVMAEAGRDRDHEAHMGGGQAVERGLVPLAPSSGPRGARSSSRSRKGASMAARTKRRRTPEISPIAFSLALRANLQGAKTRSCIDRAEDKAARASRRIARYDAAWTPVVHGP